MGFNRDETITELDRFWFTEVKFWERKFGVDSDISKELYMMALKEMGNMTLKYSPFYPYPDSKYELDTEAVKDFFKYKKMDLYGKEWATKETSGCIWK